MSLNIMNISKSYRISLDHVDNFLDIFYSTLGAIHNLRLLNEGAYPMSTEGLEGSYNVNVDTKLPSLRNDFLQEIPSNLFRKC